MVQTRSVAAQIMPQRAPVRLDSTGILHPNKVASEYRVSVKVLKSVPANISVSLDSANVNAANRTTVPKENVARMEYA